MNNPLKHVCLASKHINYCIILVNMIVLIFSTPEHEVLSELL